MRTLREVVLGLADMLPHTHPVRFSELWDRRISNRHAHILQPRAGGCTAELALRFATGIPLHGFGTPVANSRRKLGRAPFGARLEDVAVSTFDDPFDPQRSLTRAGCVCGQHVSQAEHALAQQPQLSVAGRQSEEKRYQGVVAAAVMRAIFPRDAARRAFLKSVGALTALAALSQFFPLKTATEVFAEDRAPEKKDSRSGSSRSPAPRLSSWRTRWGSTAGTA